nr:C21ORF9 [Homo sapiens]
MEDAAKGMPLICCLWMHKELRETTRTQNKTKHGALI